MHYSLRGKAIGSHLAGILAPMAQYLFRPVVIADIPQDGIEGKEISQPCSRLQNRGVLLVYSLAVIDGNQRTRSWCKTYILMSPKSANQAMPSLMG